MPRSEEYKRRNDPYAPDKLAPGVYPKIEQSKVEKVAADSSDDAADEAEPEPEPEEDTTSETSEEEISIAELEGDPVDIPLDPVDYLRGELDEIGEGLGLTPSDYATKGDIADAINEIAS